MRITFLNPIGEVGGGERVLLAAIRGAREHIPGARLEMVLFADGPLRAEAERLGAAVRVVPLPAKLASLGDTRLRDKDRPRTLAWLGFGWATLKATPAAVGFVRRLRAALRRSAPDLIHFERAEGPRPRRPGPAPRGAGALAPARLPLTPPGDGPLAPAVGYRGGWRNCHLGRGAAGRGGGPPQAGDLGRPERGGHGPLRAGSGRPRRGRARPPRRATAGRARCGPCRAGGDLRQLEGAGRLPRRPGPALCAGPPVRGYIVGGPIYATAGSQFTRDELERRAAANGLAGRVGFVSFRPDPADVYRMLDVAVNASTRPEPFGLTIAEAMGCGKPVVVAAAGGAAELFTPGDDGLGHVPGDAAGLASAIARLAADPGLRARLGANARRTAVERFSQERYGREIAAVYAAIGRVGRNSDQWPVEEQ